MASHNPADDGPHPGVGGLANSIGSVREVVSRILSEPRASGIVTTTPGRMAVSDVESLAEIVHSLVI